MAETVVVIDALLKKLEEPNLREIPLFWGFNSTMKQMSTILSTVQSILQDAEMKQSIDVSVKKRLGRLRDVVYYAEQVLDEVGYEALRYKIEIRNRFKKKVYNFFSPTSNPLVFRLKMAPKVNKISEIFDEVAEERLKHSVRSNSVEDSHFEEHPRITPTLLTEQAVYGRMKEKSNLIKLLLESPTSDEEEALSVIPIVGMAGIGKTTLTRLVYNDKLVVRQFELRMWVDVSGYFDIKKITREIIEATTGSANSLRLDSMLRMLKDMLLGKRFLLVLDDVWHEDKYQSSSLKDALLCGARGSCMIVTTRQMEVAEKMSTVTPYGLEKLSDEDCWAIFKARAFRIDKAESYPNLVSIGREIASNCGGVPLVANVLGGMLRFKREEHEWQSIKTNKIWDEYGLGKDILPVIKLGFDNLPALLQNCFSYCSVFPKNHNINKKMLIEIWIAHGYLARYDPLEMEAVGDECFRVLLNNGYFQSVKESKSGDIKTCKVNDLLLGLAHTVAGRTCLNVQASSVQEDIEEARHMLLVPHQAIMPFPEPLCKAKKLHTFVSLVKTYANTKYISSTIFFNFTCLRVLDMSNSNIEELSPLIGNLKYLRYLDLSRTDVKVLPESVTSLYYLRTFKLKHCHRLEELPKNARRLVNLVHFVVSNRGYWNQMPRKIGELTSLQTLPVFVVGKNREQSIGELKSLGLLRGKLEICQLQNVKSEVDASEANLLNKAYIDQLKLSWENDSEEDEEMHGKDLMVLEALQPHRNLKKLDINYYMGVKFPTWIDTPSLLDHLVEISLWHCYRCDKLPALGRLPRLLVLKLHQMKSIKLIGREFYGGSSEGEVTKAAFPSLKTLFLDGMPDLESWEAGLPSAFPFLEELSIDECPKLISMPTSFTKLVELRIVNSNSKIEQLLGTSNITSVKSIVLKGSPELIFLPEEFLRNNKELQSLEINNCPNFKSICPSEEPQQVEHLNSLQSLEICDCPAASLQVVHRLPSLRSLIITNCETLKSLPEGLQLLTTLKELRFGGFSEQLGSVPQLYLPEQLQGMTTLEELVISDFPHLVALPEWLRKFTSLRSLKLRGCESLKFLPSAEAFKCLKQLKRLKVVDCPLLKEMCEKLKEELEDNKVDVSYSSTLS